MSHAAFRHIFCKPSIDKTCLQYSIIIKIPADACRHNHKNSSMNFNNFTIKSQEAIQKAVELTRATGAQSIEPVVLLKGVIDEGESLVKFIFQKIGANIAAVNAQIEREIAALPKVSGGEPYLSRTANDVLQKALDIAKKQGDEYVALEALLLALFDVNSPASTILKDAGLSRKELEAAVEELRKGKKATDQNSEETYNALSK